MPNTSNPGRHFLRLTQAAAVVAALAVAAPAYAQQSETRWLAFAGCWTPEPGSAPIGATATSGSMVCVVPIANSNSADIATIANNRVVFHERVNAGGDRVSKTVDKCPGWQSASWSADGNRLFLRSEFACGDSLKVKGSSVFSISADGRWVQVQGSSVGRSAGARVLRFMPASVTLAQGSTITDSAAVTTVPAESGFALQSVRTAAGGVASTDAIVDLAKNVDEQVTQAWLAEFGRPTRLSAKELVALADGGVSSATIDLMVAMSYPERFQLQQRQPAAEDQSRPTSYDINRGMNNGRYADCDYDGFGMLRVDQARCMQYGSMYGYYPFNYLSTSGYGSGYGYGNMYRNNYYYGQSPIIIITRGDDSGGVIRQPQGRAVKGGGYTRDTSPSAESNPRTSTSSGSSSSGSSSGASTSTSSGSSSGGDAGGRTAKPRTPPPLN